MSHLSIFIHVWWATLSMCQENLRYRIKSFSYWDVRNEFFLPDPFPFGYDVPLGIFFVCCYWHKLRLLPRSSWYIRTFLIRYFRQTTLYSFRSPCSKWCFKSLWRFWYYLIGKFVPMSKCRMLLDVVILLRRFQATFTRSNIFWKKTTFSIGSVVLKFQIMHWNKSNKLYSILDFNRCSSSK